MTLVMARALPPSAARRSRAQRPGTNLRTHADPSSALTSTYIGASAEPVLSLLYLFRLFFSSSIYLWGTPRGPIPLPDSSQPPIRDFRPLIPVHGGRRLHGRLGGQSPAYDVQNRHHPRGFPSPCRDQSAGPGLPSNLQGDRTYLCQPQPPPNPQPASTPRAGQQPNPPTTRQPNWNAPPPTGSAQLWPP